MKAYRILEFAYGLNVPEDIIHLVVEPVYSNEISYTTGTIIESQGYGYIYSEIVFDLDFIQKVDGENYLINSDNCTIMYRDLPEIRRMVKANIREDKIRLIDESI